MMPTHEPEPVSTVWKFFLQNQPAKKAPDLFEWLAYHAFVRRQEHEEAWWWSVWKILESGYPYLTNDPITLAARPYSERTAKTFEDDPPTDSKGWPMTIYNRHFSQQLCIHLTLRGVFPTFYDAALDLSLADRYAKRGEWVSVALTRLLYRPEPIPAALVKEAAAYFHTASLRPRKPPRKQLSFF